jgi:hypothetical protein
MVWPMNVWWWRKRKKVVRVSVVFARRKMNPRLLAAEQTRMRYRRGSDEYKYRIRP